jgi:hypothetical protein
LALASRPAVDLRRWYYPHVPATQFREQHCAPKVQALPMSKHAQNPATQLSEQHCESVLHALPSLGQTPPQNPLMHDPVQHSVFVPQASPSAEHVGGGVAHVRFEHSAEQHWLSSAQWEPFALHTNGGRPTCGATVGAGLSMSASSPAGTVPQPAAIAATPSIVPTNALMLMLGTLSRLPRSVNGPSVT